MLKVKTRRSQGLHHYLTFLDNELCLPIATFFDLNPHELNQGLCRYPFMVSLDKCNESCNTLARLHPCNAPSSRACAPNKTEDANSKILNIITEIN